MSDTKAAMQRAIAVLTLMQRYYEDLPDPSPLINLKGCQRRELLHALAVAEKPRTVADGYMEVLDEDFVDVLLSLDKALPDDWPSNSGSFARVFIACAHGHVPAQQILNTATGEITTVKLCSKKIH